MDQQNQQVVLGRPTAAFVGASWVALGIGASLFFIGLYNAHMVLAEKGFLFTVFLLGIFAAISVQKAVRDRAEDVPVTGVYLGVSWGMLLAALTLMTVGLWNADLLLSEKGFYGIGFTMSLFSVVAVQKNVRDLAAFREAQPARERRMAPLFPPPPQV
ncbi:inner membrane protein YiaA [Microbacterium sp. NPDC008134]|uniref:inner membrane protein YiaA n=1 Tax=Microbacterium sp. NPDC008134 TaxID=3364183 RepID=UPI0036EFF816